MPSIFPTSSSAPSSRRLRTEFGAPMDTGLNYNNACSTNNFVRYLRADTNSLRALNMGSVYWPALGGKITAGQNYDWYSMFALHGSGTNLTVSIRNSTGADRLKHGWGDDGGGDTGAVTLTARHSGKCLNVEGGSTASSARITQLTCNGGQNQQFMRNATGAGS